jgi:uncharacterized membrane protein (DUF485 family)
MAPINNVHTTLSGGAIAGIVIAVVVFIVLLVISIIYLAKHKAAQAHQHSLQAQKERNAKGLTRKRDGTLSTPRPDIVQT